MGVEPEHLLYLGRYHRLHDLYYGLGFKQGRVHYQVVMGGIWYFRLEILFHQPPVFRFHPGNVLSRIFLRESKFFHGILDPQIQGGDKAQADLFIRG